MYSALNWKADISCNCSASPSNRSRGYGHPIEPWTFVKLPAPLALSAASTRRGQQVFFKLLRNFSGSSGFKEKKQETAEEAQKMKKQIITTVTTLLLAATFITPAWAAGSRVRQVNHRERNQQQRIANGLDSGKLNATETARIERREAQIKREERSDRAAHNGYLTRADQRDLNRDLNRTSRMIFRQKHD